MASVHTVYIRICTVVGIGVRTTNKGGQAMQDIPPLWQRFYDESLSEKIPDRIDDEVLGLYSDYESDHTEPYTLIIGCRVNSFDSIPEDMVAKSVPSARYAVFTAQGKFPESLIKKWQDIWTSDLYRTYTGDFEVYGEQFGDPENSEVEVYVAIR